MKRLMQKWRVFLSESVERNLEEVVSSVANPNNLNLQDLLLFSLKANSDPDINKLFNSKSKISHRWSSTQLKHAAGSFAWVGGKSSKRVIHYHTSAWEELVYDIYGKYGEIIQAIKNINYREILQKLAIVLFSKTVIHEMAHHEDPTHLVSTGLIGDIDILDKKSYNKIRKIALTDPDFLENIELYAFGKELQYSNGLKSKKYQLVKDYVIPTDISLNDQEILEKMLKAFLNDPDYEPTPATMPGTIQDYFPEFGDEGEE